MCLILTVYGDLGHPSVSVCCLLVILICCCTAIPPFWRPPLGAAIRFGEADHPGPVDQGDESIGFCITNPTTFNHKIGTYLELIDTTKCHLVSCSETSATSTMQASVSVAFRRKDVKTLWSPPVEPMRATVTGSECARGQASGVALLSKLPCRPARLDLPTDWMTTTRILHSIVQLGCSHIQLFVVYCRPLNNPYSASFNNELMSVILRQAALLPLPWICMGDFNCCPDTLECWPHLASQGFCHLAEMYEKIYNSKMPPSCKGSTNPDTAILSPALAPLVNSICVLDSSWTPTHCPVVFRLGLPSHGLFHHKFVFPKSFIPLGLEDDDLASCVGHVLEQYPEPQSLEDWGGLVEEVVSHTLKTKGIAPNLPKAFRGRCKPLKPKLQPIHCAIKPASQGDYNPPVEVITMASRRKVKQQRRIDSLCQRMRRYERIGATTACTKQELSLEWNAILRCRAFGGSFLHWVLALGVLPFPAWPLPSASWLHDLSQLVKHEVDSCIYRDFQLRKDHLEFQRVLDSRYSNKKAFAAIRGPGNPTITETVSQVDFEALVAPSGIDQHFDLYADDELLAQLDLSQPLQVGSWTCKPVHREQFFVTVHSCEPLPISGVPVPVQQKIFHFGPQAVAKDLNAFWEPIWQRDAHDLSFVTAADPTTHFDLLRDFTRSQEIPVDMLDTDQWSIAIRKLKAGSARGVDSISAAELKMLPLELISSLAKVLHQQINGFEADLMIGITCPLAKTAGLPVNSATRPITVLPQVYRLWAAVACQQLSRWFAIHIPKEVTGLLPHRGSFDTAYYTQFQIELARYRDSDMSGLTLDIRKCFNHLQWQFVYALLWLLGVPVALLEAWISSISRLRRVWLIHGQVQDACSATTGLPEGCVFSVISMIAVNTFWIWHVRARCTAAAFSPSALSLSAYADNWAWTVTQFRLHFVILSATLEFLSCAGLLIDYAKTWFWATRSSDIPLVQSQIAEALPGVIIQHKSSASDLGFQLQYSGSFRLGINQERVDKGLLKLRRVQCLRQSVPVKAKLIRMGVFPSILYGSAIRPPSSDTLDSLRSSTAQALMGSCPGISAAICLLLAPGGILDPEYWMLCMIFRTVRLFLLHANPDIKLGFLRIASSFRGPLASVRGPASAFGFCLRQLSWNMTSSGVIHVNGFLSFDLGVCSFQRFRRFITWAWQEQLVMQRTQRRAWFHFPDIAVGPTTAVLHQFHAGHLKTLLRENAGGFQSCLQKAKWLDTEDGTCPYCDEPDTREHRLLRCPIGAEIRSDFTDLLTWFEDSGSGFPEFPFITVDPNREALTCMLFAIEVPPFEQSILDFVASRCALQQEIHWFTDGACYQPDSPESRYAAFAIAVDLCDNNASRILHACASELSDCMPDTFQKILASRTPGEQDILRSEMLAAATVMLGIGDGVIHVDNQAAVTLLNLALSCTDPAVLYRKDHFDILIRVWEKRQSIRRRVVKVKGHADLRNISDPLEQYWCWGNKFVDEIAVHARDHCLPDLAAALINANKDLQCQLLRLKQTYQLQLELQTLRAKAHANLGHQTAAAQQTGSAILTAFQNWRYNPAISLTGYWDDQFWQHSMFGSHLLGLTSDWVRLLRWPPSLSTDGPLGFKTGVSWVELALSWMIHCHCYLPIIRPDVHGQKRLIQPATYAVAREKGLCLTEVGTTLQKMWESLKAMTPQTFSLPGQRIKVASLYHMGTMRYVQGWSIRFEFPHQDIVMELIQQMVQKGHKIISHTPDLSDHLDETANLWNPSEDYETLLKLSGRAQYHVRKARQIL